MILSCICESAAQDKLNGRGKRVYNQKKRVPGISKDSYSCTVCGRTQDVARAVTIADDLKTAPAVTEAQEPAPKQKFSANKKERQSKPGRR
jgi:hypothetical protein